MSTVVAAEPKAKKGRGKGPSAAEKRSALWNGLNDRQQLYLRTIYEADQDREAEVRAAAAEGYWNQGKAEQWRQLDAYHEPTNHRYTTDLQRTWDALGHHNQGNGSTIAVLQEAGLILLGGYQTRAGTMHTVRITTLGRQVVRAATGQTAYRRSARGFTLSERSVEVLGLLYAAYRTPERVLKWRGRSTTIDVYLIDKASEQFGKPLAESRAWYQLTDFGAEYYTKYYRLLQDAYPALRLPIPDGVDAPEPWPDRADQLLAGLHQGYRGLISYLANAQAALEKAAAETDAPAPAAPAPRTAKAVTLLARLQAEADTLRQKQDRQRADLAAKHARQRVDQLTGHITAAETGIDQALVVYIFAVIAATQALVDDADVCTAITAEQNGHRVLTEPAPLPVTGVAAVDLEARRLWDAWVTKAKAPRSRGQVKRPRPVTGIVGLDLPRDLIGTTVEAPYALARHLHTAMHGGVLHRQLQAVRTRTTTTVAVEEAAP